MQAGILRLWQATRFTALFVTQAVEEPLVLTQRAIVLWDGPAAIRIDLPVLHPDPRRPGTGASMTGYLRLPLTADLTARHRALGTHPWGCPTFAPQTSVSTAAIAATPTASHAA